MKESKYIFQNESPMYVTMFLIFVIVYSWNLPVDLHIKLFLPTGQQDVYDKTGNNNTVEVSAKINLVSLR